MTEDIPTISAQAARRLLLRAQGLAEEPSAATAASVNRLIERMGFVQVDTISTVERAHHLILASRLSGYRPAMLAERLERRRTLFEHWTHDASIIPLKWYPHWRHRFARYATHTWYLKNLGADRERITARVLERVAKEGPLTSRDFEHEGPPGAKGNWWSWKPHKFALDYLWRTGRLHVAGRRNFDKVYDLPERCIPSYAAMPASDEAAHVEWACASALERLGVATAIEVRQFWHAAPTAAVDAWLKRAVAEGRVAQVRVESADGSAPKVAYGPADLRRRIRDLPEMPATMRLLCPFDPVLRDRARAHRLFNFHFRFEAFVPAAQRKHGYYVMPILRGDELVGKVDPKFDRTTGTLHVRKVWWEPGVKQTRRLLASLEEAAHRLAEGIGARSVEIH
jgi:uncharacterized protein